MASLKGRHFSFSDRLYFRKIFQLAGKGHTNVSAVWRKGDPTMQTEISLKGQYKNTVFSFLSSLKLCGEGCGSGHCLAPSGLASALSLRLWTSLFSETANCVHPSRLCVCPPGWKTGSPTDSHPARQRGKTRSTDRGFPLLQVNSGEELRVGFVLDGWFGDF